MTAVTTNMSETPDDKVFKQRVELSKLLLKEKDLDMKAADAAQNKEIVKMQMKNRLTKM